MRTLLIDDFREYNCDRTARTPADGIKALKEEGPWDEVYIDHDMGIYQSDEPFMNGMDVLKWIEQNLQFLPGKIYVVTMNPVARKEMQLVVDKLYNGG